MNGSIRLMGGGRVNVSLTSEDPSIARLFKQMIQSYFDTTTSLDILCRRRRCAGERRIASL